MVQQANSGHSGRQPPPGAEMASDPGGTATADDLALAEELEVDVSEVRSHYTAVTTHTVYAYLSPYRLQRMVMLHAMHRS